MSDQIADRRAKLEKLRALGVDPWGTRFPDTIPHAAIRAEAEKLSIPPGEVLERPEALRRAAGRVVLYRDIGSLIFLTVRDRSGDLQYGISKGMISAGPSGPTPWQVAKLLDLGDILGGVGYLGRTKTGELTLWLTSLTLLAKALRPPPEKWHGLTDVELRYRRRYVDLFANPESREIFLKRARLINFLRRELVDRGFVEVETPVLQPIYGGAAARPFVTHHRALDLQLYLRISPELYLKRCLVGGLERVFEFARCFRNEGISPRHNPEFTMLELYQACGDYHDMMELCEALVAGAACELGGSYRVARHRLASAAGDGPEYLDFTPPWPRLKYADLFEQHVGLPMSDMAAIRDEARKVRAEFPDFPDEADLDHALVIHALFEHYVEDRLIQPTFVLDWPAELCPLTRRDPQNPQIALRFELYAEGMELANAYTELNDPDAQRQNLQTQVRGEGDETMRVLDEDFIEALEYGMPPAGGLGIGIDRLAMLLTASASIRDVLLFPLQRPQRTS